MSQSACIKCGNPVSMYEKYCQTCVDTSHLRQDPMFHLTHAEWDLQAELIKDQIEMPEAEPEENDQEPLVEVTDKNKKIVHQPKPKPVPTGRKGRVACLGGCGTMVIPTLGECRKCRKARLRAGKKHSLKLQKETA